MTLCYGVNEIKSWKKWYIRKSLGFDKCQWWEIQNINAASSVKLHWIYLCSIWA